MALGSNTEKSDDKTEKTAATPARNTVLVDTAEAHTDRVAMVSRDKNGNADQSGDYELLVPDDASTEEKRAAENKPADHQVD